MALKTHQVEFIELALKYQVLSFGHFTLKSGRESPYFYNAGLFNDGAALSALGRIYAQTIEDSDISFDVLFGPAYKGIPLVTCTAQALLDQHGHNFPYCFNRKEVKDHGEGGQTVGAPLSGRVLVIDDVMTAGTALRETDQLLKAHPATLAGMVVALDRQERAQGTLSAVQQVQMDYQIPVCPIIRLTDIISYLQQDTKYAQVLVAIQKYRETYGVGE